MFFRSSPLRFPLWQFLNQPVFDRSYQLILSPRRFWRMHSIITLERCLMKEMSSRDTRCD
jgi:hypothetical protein